MRILFVVVSLLTKKESQIQFNLFLNVWSVLAKTSVAWRFTLHSLNTELSKQVIIL